MSSSLYHSRPVLSSQRYSPAPDYADSSRRSSRGDSKLPLRKSTDDAQSHNDFRGLVSSCQSPVTSSPSIQFNIPAPIVPSQSFDCLHRLQTPRHAQPRYQRRPRNGVNPLYFWPAFRQYRNRQAHKDTGKGEGGVWRRPELEDAFVDSVMLMPHMGRRKFSMGGKRFGRNMLISEYIFITCVDLLGSKEIFRIDNSNDSIEQMGRRQVSSHMQVVKKFFEDLRCFHFLFPSEGEKKPGTTNSDDFYDEEEQESFKSSPILTALAEGRIPDVKPNYEYFSQLLALQASITVRPRTVEVFVSSPDVKIHDEVAYDANDTPLDPALFPHLKKYMNSDDTPNVLGKDVLLHEYTRSLDRSTSACVKTVTRRWQKDAPAMYDSLDLPPSDVDCLLLEMCATMDLHEHAKFPSGSELTGFVEVNLTRPGLQNHRWKCVTKLTRPSELHSEDGKPEVYTNESGIHRRGCADSRQDCDCHMRPRQDIAVPFPAVEWVSILSMAVQYPDVEHQRKKEKRSGKKHELDRAGSKHKRSEDEGDAAAWARREPTGSDLICKVAMYQELWSCAPDSSHWTRQAIIFWRFCTTNQWYKYNPVFRPAGTTWRWLTVNDPMSRYHQQKALVYLSATGSRDAVMSPTPSVNQDLTAAMSKTFSQPWDNNAMLTPVPASNSNMALFDSFFSGWATPPPMTSLRESSSISGSFDARKGDGGSLPWTYEPDRQPPALAQSQPSFEGGQTGTTFADVRPMSAAVNHSTHQQNNNNTSLQGWDIVARDSWTGTSAAATSAMHSGSDSGAAAAQPPKMEHSGTWNHNNSNVPNVTPLLNHEGSSNRDTQGALSYSTPEKIEPNGPDLDDMIRTRAKGLTKTHSPSNFDGLSVEDTKHYDKPTIASVPFSDSAYGTATHCSFGIPPENKTSTCNLEESQKHPKDTKLDDAATIYSDAMSLSGPTIEAYVSELGEGLFRRLDSKVLNDEIVESLSKALPGLLKALALGFGHIALSQMHRDVMFFLHKNQRAITGSFRSSYFQWRDSHLEPEPTHKEAPAMEIMNRWLAAPEELGYEHVTTTEDDPTDISADDSESADGDLGSEDDDSQSQDGDASMNVPRLEEYRKFISGSPGYEWLLGCLRREIALARPSEDIMQQTREKILNAIPRPRRISRNRSSQECRVVYYVDWDPFAFLAEQNYEELEDEAVTKAITLTGSGRYAQALSCGEYLAQTWPCTGPCTMQLIRDLVRSREEGATINGKTLGGTNLSATLVKSHLLVKVSGVPDFIAEIGEQLAWLGAALHPAPPSSEVVCCVPFIDSTLVDTHDDGHNGLRCSIKFRLEEWKESSTNVNGQCWHAMFRRVVIARGFPVPRRPEADTGLELPLDMMAALARARYIDIYNSKLFIKGFSTMLVPTRRVDDVFIWHLLYNSHPNARISYLDCPIKQLDCTVAELEQTRHIIGWCPEAVCNIGISTANYSIQKSNLPRTHSGCALEKVEIQAGQFILGTASFSLGNREKPVHISRFGYVNKMQWISSKHIVFWDEEDSRGWLVNGASALLHLVRASLEHTKRKFKSAFLLDPANFADAEDPTQPESAIDTLTDQKNRELPLYIDKREVYEEETKSAGESTTHVVTNTQTRYYRLEDRIEHFYNIIEKLVDHQTDIEQRNGLQINLRPRRLLEGWDFKDLVTDGDPFLPRVSTLQTMGKGWVDFTRAIHAVTLFGRGFGELIQPKRTSCSRWSRLPTGRYYLAACVSDLKEIIEEDGDSSTNPVKVCENMLWHMKQATFRPCPCTGVAASKHHDPVQALFPSRFKSMLKRKPQVNLEDRGAVIFGHNMNLHWHWRDSGDPVKGDPPLESEEATELVYDSGLRSSLNPSSRGAASSELFSTKSSASNTPPSSQPDTSVTPAAGTSQAESVPSTSMKRGLLAGSKRRFPEGRWFTSKRRKP